MKNILLSMVILCCAGCAVAEQKVDLNDGIPDFEYLARESRKQGEFRYRNIEEQLLAWHPYGSSFEALKQRITSGEVEYFEPSNEKWGCLPKVTIGCKSLYTKHIFFGLNKTLSIVVGEEGGKIVFLSARLFNKNL